MIDFATSNRATSALPTADFMSFRTRQTASATIEERIARWATTTATRLPWLSECRLKLVEAPTQRATGPRLAIWARIGLGQCIIRAAKSRRETSDWRSIMSASKGSEPVLKIVIEKNVAMRTRDGITLKADVYRPAGSGKFPVLVVRTPYDKSAGMALTEPDYFTSRGYVVVVQDTRGRHSSEGEFVPFVHEARDGSDTIEWAASLPYSNGVVGTVGQSYMGLVQYLTGTQRPPHSQSDEPGIRAGELFREFCLPARGVRAGLGAGLLRVHGARHNDAQGRL